MKTLILFFVTLTTLSISVSASEKPKTSIDTVINVKVDSTVSKKEIFMVKINNYESFEVALKTLQKAGYKPACRNCLFSVVKNNSELASKMRWMITLDQESLTNKNGLASWTMVMWDKKANAFYVDGYEKNTTTTDDWWIVVTK